MFGTVKLVTNLVKSKFIYNDWEIAFDGECYWSFDNDHAKNAVTFGPDKSLLYHTDNRKNDSIRGMTSFRYWKI